MSAAATMMIAPVVCNDASEIRSCGSVSISPVIVKDTDAFLLPDLEQGSVNPWQRELNVIQRLRVIWTLPLYFG